MKTMGSKAKPFAWQGFTASFGFALGDISISMIYAFKAVFISQDGKPDETIVLGVLSMIFWLIMLISVLKYSIIMMRADNKGEGGLFALYSIVRKYWKYMPIIAIIGGACLMADAVFAPSNTILTIIEGMPSVNAMNNNPFWNQGMAMLTAVIIIIILFATQHHGHGGNGRNYGIIMMIYLAFSGIVGIYWIIQYPWILTAMNPMNAIKFITGSDVGHVIGILSCVSLAISGSEALTANQGQYGKKNIKASWSIALICIFMSYFGQGAFILKTMTALDAGDPSPYFLMIMEPLRPFALILALMTGIIACQSLLNSAFVLAQAADGLGWIPRLKISYNGMDKGKVYVSSLNVVLCLMSIAIVLFFRTSTAMESAYNLALTTAMFMDTIMIWFWYRNIRMKPLSGTILCILFGAAELVMLTTSMIMVIEGAYVTISIAIIIMGILYVCMKGQKIERSRRRRINAGKLVPMLSTVINDANMDMIADNLIYLTPDANMDNVEKDIAISMVHHRARMYWIVSIVQSDTPYACEYSVKSYGGILHHVKIRLGYKQPQYELQAYMRRIMKDMIRTHDIPKITPQWPELASKNEKAGIGTVKYVIMHRVMSPESEMPDNDRFILRMFQSLKKLMSHPVEWFGLETNAPIIETIPLFRGAEPEFEIKRIMPRKPRKITEKKNTGTDNITDTGETTIIMNPIDNLTKETK